MYGFHTSVQLSVYIHANPVSLIEPGWKERGIKNLQKTIKFLENYKWSSYLDYLGNKNFPSVTKREFILEMMNESAGCQKSVVEWLKRNKEISSPYIFLEEPDLSVRPIDTTNPKMYGCMKPVH